MPDSIFSLDFLKVKWNIWRLPEELWKDIGDKLQEAYEAGLITGSMQASDFDRFTNEGGTNA